MTTAGGLRRELGTAFATKVLLAVFLAVLVFAAAAGASLGRRTVERTTAEPRPGWAS